MRKIRVLIVDDSLVIRRLLSDALASDPMIEVAGVAANGKIALTKIPALTPDIVTLDMEMPEMDGLTTLTELRKLYPKLPVVMFSTLTQQGAKATIEALARGANDYVTKPSNVGSVNAAIQSVNSDLVPKLKELCGVLSPSTTPAPKPSSLFQPSSKTSTLKVVGNARNQRIDLVVIGTSTGGPSALSAVIPKLPKSFPLPILVVQHMPPIFTTHLAERLSQLSELDVHEANEGDTIEPGGVWLAPGNYHMTIRRQGTQLKVALNQNAPECSCRPSVDVLFRSAADLFGKNLLGLVMTGMGQDGLVGADHIRQAGGMVLTQDQATSVVWGMPGAVTQAGLANRVLPLATIAQELTNLAQTGRSNRPMEMAVN